MPEWVNKILKHNSGEKSLKAPITGFRMYIKKITKQSRKILYRKKARHEPSGWSMFIRCSFDEKKNKLNYNRGKDCIEKLCKKLKETATEIINREKKEIVPLTHEENNFYNEQEICYI